MKHRYLFFPILFSIFVLFSCSDSSTTDPIPEFSFDHEMNPGTSARDFLRDDDFENLVIEINYMEGFRPTDEALANLASFLEDRLHKTTVTILSPTVIPALGHNSYSANEIRDLEREHRTVFSEENTLAAYILVVDGEFSQATVLGIAHFNTSMALFGETIQSTSDGLAQLSRATVETVVMQHETGHLIGLVNNGVDMQHPHQDEENGKHCDTENCLMYHTVQTTDFFATLFGESLPELDEYCLADLAAAGGK